MMTSVFRLLTIRSRVWREKQRFLDALRRPYTGDLIEHEKEIMFKSYLSVNASLINFAQRVLLTVG